MSFEDKRFCVYLHRRKDNNEIFYVGQGILNRATNKTQRSKKWSAVVLDAGGFVVEVVENNLQKDEAFKIEQELVDKYREHLINRKGGVGKVKELCLKTFSERFYVDSTSVTGLRYKLELMNGKSIHTQKNSVAGRVGPDGYYRVKVLGLTYKVHRIIYLLSTGSIDKNLIVDHIDGNRQNNNIENLRLVTPRSNSINRKTDSRNSTGFNGVTYKWQYASYVASVSVFGCSPAKVIAKSFSVNKYGREQALQLAVAWRQQKEQEYGYLNNSTNKS